MASPRRSRGESEGTLHQFPITYSSEDETVTDLFRTLRIEQNPAELNDFSRVLGDKNAVLVTGSSDVDDHIAVQVGFWTRVVCHGACSLLRS